MAEETPRSSARISKFFYKSSSSNLPESPLGATPRPDLRQHYPPPPPQINVKSAYSVREFATDSFDTGSNDSNFTQLRKKPSEYTEVREWVVDHSELNPEGSTRKALLILALTFLTALVALGVVYSSFPRL